MNNLGDSFNRREQGERQTHRPSFTFFKVTFSTRCRWDGEKKKSEKKAPISVQDINTPFERTQKRNFHQENEKREGGI